MRAKRLNQAERIAEGHALIAAKATVARGQWLKWIAANKQYTVATAQKYMREARDAQPVPESVLYSGVAHYPVPVVLH